MTRLTLAAMGTVLNMQASSLSVKYLGSYLYRGVNRAIYCQSLLQHFDAKLSGWKRHLLTPRGRLVLLNSVRASLPLHLMAAARLTKSVINSIQRRMANFIWGTRHHWVS